MSELNKNQFTLKEASAFSGKDYSTVYRSVKKGKLPSKKIIINNEEITVIEKQDLIKVFKLNVPEENSSSQPIPAPEQSPKTENYLTKENLKETFKEFLSEQHSQLMKPLEDQALFISGKLSQENQFLKEKIETLLQELDKYKALPGPVDEVINKIKEKETALTETSNLLESEKSTRKQLEQEKEKLLEEIQTKTKESHELKKQIESLPCPPESVNKVFLNNSENIQSLQKEKNELETLLKQQEIEKEKLREQAEKEKSELETLIKQQEMEKEKLKEQSEKEKIELEATIKAQTEEEKKQIAEAWKKELELAKKPWWKFW